MRMYCVDADGKVVEERGTLTKKQYDDGSGLILADDPPKAEADPDTGGWKKGSVPAKSAVYTTDDIRDFLTVPKAHLLNAVAFPARK